MSEIAFLGAGLMASGFVEAALARGERVRVWNRTAAKLRPLVEKGAHAADSAADAVRGAERVHVMLSDDAAVDATLRAARPALAASTMVIDHTTVSPAGTVARAAWLEREGIELLSAPVFMAPQNCRDATGIMLCAGPRARFDRAEPHLAKMTGKLWWVGERPDLAAVYKLLGNAMILTIVGGLDDVFRMGRAAGISATDAHALFSHFKPAMTIDVRGARMARGDFAATFEATMARKDARLMLELAATGGERLTVLPEIARRLDEAIAAGLGAEDVGVIARDAVRPR